MLLHARIKLEILLMIISRIPILSKKYTHKFTLLSRCLLLRKSNADNLKNSCPFKNRNENSDTDSSVGCRKKYREEGPQRNLCEQIRRFFCGGHSLRRSHAPDPSC